jgi:catechol 2,3-dioxygenase-like lactoylglutathione lyase family enzyme
MKSLFVNLILDVEDLDRSLASYRDSLSLAVRHEEQLDGYRLAFMQTGGTEITLLEQPAVADAPPIIRRGGQVLKFYVRDLPTMVEGLLGQAVTVLRDIELPMGGERSCLIADPDGYAILLAEPVADLN